MATTEERGDKLNVKATYRLKGHGQPADLSPVYSHRSMRKLSREQVGFRERVTVRMEQRQNGRQFIT